MRKAWVRSFVLTAATCACATHAAERRLIEEIIVTAQRVQESAQRVPIAVTAFDETMIEDRQIILLSDLQIQVPNFTYNDQNFGRGVFSIRGIGQPNTSVVSEPGVSVHFDEIPLPLTTPLEILDVERIETLRGPQGTLYGRNATGGVVNFVTNKPHRDGFDGYVDLELGNYEHRRLKGAINVPLGDRAALRAYGNVFKRDGLVDNLAANDFEGLDEEIDDREWWSGRLVGTYWFTDNLTLTASWTHFDEDDHRLRFSHRLCRQRQTLTLLGCEPGADGFDAELPDATDVGGIARLYGARELGSFDVDFERPRLNYREHHTDFQPRTQREEDTFTANLKWEAVDYVLDVNFGYREWELFASQDLRNDVGFSLEPTPLVPDDLWPTSSVRDAIGSVFTDPDCPVQEGLFGIAGGCIYPADQNRAFSYDAISQEEEFWTTELKLRSDFEGPVNFVVGFNYASSDKDGDFRVVENVKEQFGRNPLPGFTFLPEYPNVNYIWGIGEFESYAAFGELYWDLGERLRLTAGLRYNDDHKETETTALNVQSIDVGPFLQVAGRQWIRGELGPLFVGAPLEGNRLALADLYGASDAIRAAQSDEELLAAVQRVPIVPPLGENAELAGVETEEDWREVSGRLGLTYFLSSDSMIYAFYSRGYKPGGALGNSLFEAVTWTDAETVNAYEIGSKNVLADGALVLNLAAFYNDYDDMQYDFSDVTPDAKMYGVELESTWLPPFLPNLQLNLAYSWLDTEFTNGESFEAVHIAETLGDPDLIQLRGITGGTYVAPVDQVLPLVDAAVAAGAAVPLPDNVYDNGVPVFFDPRFLFANDVDVSFSLPVDFEGNQTLYAPEHTVSLGATYSWFFRPGNLVLRWDYYWQDDSTASPSGLAFYDIDSYDQHNATLAFESASGQWTVRGWIRNVFDEDNVNGLWPFIPTGAGARNVFLNEPRLYGATLRYSFGAR